MKAIQHIAFNCRDMYAQEKFYTQHFGFSRARVFNPGTPNEFLMLRLGSACLELFQAPADAPEKSSGEQPVGFKHLAFEVEDIYAARNVLIDSGIDIDDVIDCDIHCPGLLVCFFRDPEGNIIELMQDWQDE